MLEVKTPGDWRCAMAVLQRDGDVDEYRAKWGKAEGERRFFAERPIRRAIRVPDNKFLIGGTSLIWRCLIGEGVATANQTNSFLNAAQARIAVGDGAPTALSGTASATNNSQSITFSSTQSNLVDHHLIFSGDSTMGVYKVVAGSGTGWSLATPYGGATASGMIASRIVGELDDQTDLAAATNKVRQAMDAGFPKHVAGAGAQAITNATNSSPIEVSCVNSYNEGDFALISGVGGNTNANGIWRLTNVSGTGFTLSGSTGNAAYTSGGIATRSRVLTLQSTFGSGTAEFAWREWGLANAATGGTLLNRRVMNLGAKGPGSSWTLAVGVSIV